MPTTKTFKGEIKVASRIVDYLSSGLYKSPGSCLKELVNNSYDADAKTVYVLVKPDAGTIIIEDDGTGMNREEFVHHFDRVAESHKRDKSDHTKSGRPQIGRIGIGFIAANEICDEMEIYSTKRGSTELLHVTVNFDLMRKDVEERRRKGTDIAKGDYHGTVETAESAEHYTRVFLRRVRGEAREMLISAERAAHQEAPAASLYGMTPHQVRDRLADPAVQSWDDFDLYSQTMLQVALNVPVPYLDDWIPGRHAEVASWFTRESARPGFKVLYDGTELRKPVVLRPGDEDRDIVHTFQIKHRDVRAHCYLYAKRRALRPDQLNGVLIRIRSAAVGEYDRSFLGFPNTQERLFQDWVSGEIWASDELEDAMNIDRRTIRDAHPAFAALRDAFHIELGRFLKEARRELYQRPSGERRVRKAGEQVAGIRDAIGGREAPIPPRVAREVVEAWENYEDDPALLRRLVRKYTVTEIYDMVLDAAHEVLKPDQVQRFLAALTRRLRR